MFLMIGIGTLKNKFLESFKCIIPNKILFGIYNFSVWKLRT
jgi:hypothetical protein